MRTLRLVLALALGVSFGIPLHAQNSRIDRLDNFVKEQMSRRHIPGLSLAIIKGGKVTFAKGYGVADETTHTPVTTSTRFLAGSISKPISALGALRLVEAGRLTLDGNVNDALKSWKVPENEFTVKQKVTLRRILSHSAGLTVHGFPGYDRADTIPTLVQILDGLPPTNTPSIRVDVEPGTIWRYSGGGFTIMQLLMIDVSGKAFPEYMQETVLRPIGMMNSSFEQPQPSEREEAMASGYYRDRTPVRGKWHLYPEMAAAGLWTTATDLARVAVEIQEAYAGKGHGVISQQMARQYLIKNMGESGLGIIVQGKGRDLSFSHNGRDEGFDASLFAYAETGDGLAIMINANENARTVGRIQDFVARAWNWPPDSLRAPAPVAVASKHIDPALLNKYAGYYEFRENQLISFVPNENSTGLETLTDGYPDRSLVPLDNTLFYSSEETMHIVFNVTSGGAVTGLTWRPGEGPRERSVPHLAPLLSKLKPTVDPDQNLTNKIAGALDALRKNAAVLTAAPDITPGMKKDFAGWNGSDLVGMKSLTYLGEEEVTDRSVRRHGSPVARVRYYQLATDTVQKYLLVHVTQDGSLTDFDVVDK